MSALAAGLQRALARRERDGTVRPLAGRMLAAGPAWSVEDVVCTLGPRDRPFEERHASACVAIVAVGTFGYRSSSGDALLTPGALMLGRSGECFECGHRHAAGDRCISFHYRADWLDEQAAAAGLARGARCWSGPRVPPLRALAPLVARACANVQSGAGADPADSTGDAWDELALELAVATLRLAASGKDAREPAPARQSAAAWSRVAATLRLIDGAPDTDHSLASLAAAAGASEFYFLRTFSAVAGVTPHQYLLRARLRGAALRLVAEETKIVDIAFASGFNDVSNFNAAFRAEFGASPRAWRAQERARRRAATSLPAAVPLPVRHDRA